MSCSKTGKILSLRWPLPVLNSQFYLRSFVTARDFIEEETAARGTINQAMLFSTWHIHFLLGPDHEFWVCCVSMSVRVSSDQSAHVSHHRFLKLVSQSMRSIARIPAVLSLAFPRFGLRGKFAPTKIAFFRQHNISLVPLLWMMSIIECALILIYWKQLAKSFSKRVPINYMAIWPLAKTDFATNTLIIKDKKWTFWYKQSEFRTD